MPDTWTHFSLVRILRGAGEKRQFASFQKVKSQRKYLPEDKYKPLKIQALAPANRPSCKPRCLPICHFRTFRTMSYVPACCGAAFPPPLCITCKAGALNGATAALGRGTIPNNLKPSGNFRTKAQPCGNGCLTIQRTISPVKISYISGAKHAKSYAAQ